MLILLSCAKTMTSKAKMEVPLITTPKFKEQASILALYMSQRTVDDLEELLRVNSKLALQNQARFQLFHSSDTAALPAILAYTGIVFKRINPFQFSRSDFEYAQDHLRLTSFAYGLLRPLDGIKNYRLEGDIKLDELGGASLFDYWKDKLTDDFIADIKRCGGVLCNLASDEMKRLFHWNKIEKAVRIVTPEFKVWKAGKLKTIVVYTKMNRGEMTQYILRNRISDVDSLKSFSWEGFRYDPVLSEGDNLVFVSDEK